MSLRKLSVHLAWVAVETLLILLLLGAGRAIIYPLQTKNYVSTVNSKFEELIAITGESVEFINHHLQRLGSRISCLERPSSRKFRHPSGPTAQPDL